jgi:putative ABC transport system permease protein
MFRNYLRTAWRNVRRHRLFVAINTVGLGVGLAVCMVILIYVQHENNYDDFHINNKRIVWVHLLSSWGGDSLPMPRLSYTSALLAQQYIPQVEATVRMTNEYPYAVIQSIANPEIRYSEKNFLFADSNFFQVFSFKLAEGNPATVLSRPFTIVISRDFSRKYFGSADPVGQQILFNNNYRFTITGIVENPPSNSSVDYGCIASMSSYASMPEKNQGQQYNLLQGGAFMTYLLLKQPPELSSLEKTLATLQKRISPDNATPDRFIVTPLTQVHLSDAQSIQGNGKYLFIFPLIAGLILLLALTNYISLSTARASLRAKEIGIRKVLGANRASIASQFFIEAALYTILAFIFGYILCFLFEERFFQYLQLSIDPGFLSSALMIWSFVALFVITVLLAAVYPSILLSAYTPVAALYGKLLRRSGGMSVRKFITVFQFLITVTLIICGMVINRQVNFIRNTDTGVNRDNVVMINFPPDMGKSFPSFRSEIASLAGVKKVAVSHYQMYSGSDIWSAKTEDVEQPARLSVLNVDRQFIPLLELKWSIPPDDSVYDHKVHQILLNEEGIRTLQLKPGVLHQQVTLGNNIHLELAGILKDFNFETLQKKIGPMGLIVANDTASIWTEINGSLLAKLNTHVNLPVLMDRMKSIYEKYEQSTPFSYSFVDDAFDQLYRAEQRLSRIFLILILITIGIAALGLFGLVTFMTSQRTKEIGIRKVMGASVQQIVRMLASDFVKLVVLAWILSCPVAWMLMHKWLDNFAFRIELQWWMLAAGGLAAVLIALVTIGFQSVRAARANPVDTLRSE